MRPLLQSLIGGRSHKHPHAPAFDLVEQRAHRFAGLGEALVQLGRVAVAVPAFFVAVGMKHRDEVEQFAGAQRIVHEVNLLAGPQHHVAPAPLFGHFRRRQHGPIGDMAGDVRLAVADHHLPDGRPQAVGADQRRAAILLAALGARHDAVAGFVDRDDLLRVVETDASGFSASVEQRLVQVGAMDQCVGVRELFAERVAQRDAGDLLAADRIQHDEIVGKHRERADRRGEPEHVEHPEHVGPELDAGADLLELRRLLDELRRDALALERQRRAQAADAAADDDDGLVLPACHFGVSCAHCRSG